MNKVGDAYEYVKANPKEVLLESAKAIKDSVFSCAGDLQTCSQDFFTHFWETGSSSLAEVSKNLVLTDQKELK